MAANRQRRVGRAALGGGELSLPSFWAGIGPGEERRPLLRVVPAGLVGVMVVGGSGLTLSVILGMRMLPSAAAAAASWSWPAFDRVII